MAVNSADTSIVHLQVGDQVFVTTMGTLNVSPVLAAKFSQRWNPPASSTSTDNAASGEEPKPQKLFLDANPDTFKYILDFLRHNLTPMIWDAQQGFDSTKYVAIYQMARYYGLDDLAEWIGEEKYRHAVTQEMNYAFLEAIDLNDYRQKRLVRPDRTETTVLATSLSTKSPRSHAIAIRTYNRLDPTMLDI